MYRRALFAILAPCLFFGIFSAAADDLFQKGLAAYQSKQYAEARDDFQKLLDQGKMTPSLLNDLALTVFEMDQKPLALALWRKALSIQPGFRPAMKGRDFLESKMQMRPLERDSFNLWTHRSLEAISFYTLMWVNALILAIAGWFLISYWGERTAAVEDETTMPQFPTMPIIFLAAFLLTASLVFFKIKDGYNTRATVTGAKVSVRSLPADDGVNLFDVSGGSEVLVRQKSGGWTQVQNADGSSGWVKDGEIFITSER